MKYLVTNKHWNITEDYNLGKLLYLLIDRPENVYSVDNFRWCNDDIYNRNYDLPCYAGVCGFLSWHKDNQRHRGNNKPAIIRYSGLKEYWENGKPIKIEKNMKYSTLRY